MSSVPSIGYDNKQFQLNYPQGSDETWWNRARHRIVLRHLREQGWDKEPILDFGCGTGGAVRFLRKAGLECYGSEISPVSLQEDVRPYIMSPADVLTLPEEFRQEIRTIIALDVLEHLPDPETMLKSLKRAYPQARHLLCTVPAREELWSNYDEFFGHYRRYTLSSSLNLLSKAGYRVVEAKYFFHALYIPLWAVVRGRRRQRVLETRKPATPFLHELIASYFDKEEQWLPGKMPGTSVLMVALCDSREKGKDNAG